MFMNRLALLLIVTFFIACTSKKKEANAIIDPAKKKSPKELRTKPLIVLDAGHGGRDPGGVNDSLKLYEKNVTRNIVDALLLEIDTNKVSVLQARIGDENPHRHERIKMANLLEPDLLLSIHINSDFRDSTYSGFEISYNDSLFKEFNGTDTINYLNPYKKELHKYSYIIQNKVHKAIPKMRIRGVKPRKDDIWMIYAANHPSILFEFGYITNKKDALIMREKKEIKKLAEALKKSIYEILNLN